MVRYLEKEVTGGGQTMLRYYLARSILGTGSWLSSVATDPHYSVLVIGIYSHKHLIVVGMKGRNQTILKACMVQLFSNQIF
jgi:hypothetical protein